MLWELFQSLCSGGRCQQHQCVSIILVLREQNGLRTGLTVQEPVGIGSLNGKDQEQFWGIRKSVECPSHEGEAKEIKLSCQKSYLAVAATPPRASF